LIHPTVWPQYTNVTDRQDRQRSDGLGQTVLQSVAQKLNQGLVTLYDVHFVNESGLFLQPILDTLPMPLSCR